MESLDTLLEEATLIISESHGLGIEQSRIKTYSQESWKQFCSVNGFDGRTEGMYIPATKMAYVLTEVPCFISNVFHEFFGHGIFVENSAIGKQLTEIIEQEGDEKAFLFDEKEQQDFGLCNTNIANYEGFAMWLESWLCEETGNERVWQKKKQLLPREYQALHEHFQNSERNIGRLGIIAQMGLPKYYDKEQLLNTLRKSYAQSFEEIQHIILYGSQKPLSDIDLFIISETSRNRRNSWLDIYETDREEFTQLIEKCDLSITDPLFTGTHIYGDRNQFEQLKKQIREQPITREAIRHNLRRAREQRDLAKEVVGSARQTALGYANSYRANAEQLAQGNKTPTLARLEEIYGALRKK